MYMMPKWLFFLVPFMLLLMGYAGGLYVLLRPPHGLAEMPQPPAPSTTLALRPPAAVAVPLPPATYSGPDAAREWYRMVA